MDFDWRGGSNRRTGRTTLIMKGMMKSSFDKIYFVSPTHSMAKTHMKMFEQLAMDKLDLFCPCCKKANMELNNSKMEIYIAGKTFCFRESDYMQSVHFRGSPQADIYRDHTCYEQ